MSGPDYAWWHDIYDVAKNFYSEFMPEVKEACEKKPANLNSTTKSLKNTLTAIHVTSGSPRALTPSHLRQ
jgi:hypothetical protein